jgi:hypothetical protein
MSDGLSPRDHRARGFFGAAASGIALAAAALLTLPAQATPVEDSYVAGYVSAILEREFRLTTAKVTVADGVVTVTADDVYGAEHDRMIAALSQIRGVRKVTVATASPPPAPPANLALPLSRPMEPAPVTLVPGGGADAAAQRSGWVVFPKRKLFEPLTADPRWPHFSASFERWNGSPELGSAATVSFGETFNLLEGDTPWLGGRWQIGILASVWALFDRGSQSQDLINADYYVGVPIAWRRGSWSALARYYHVSSHLGDEFLLRGTSVKRVNLSYEVVDLKLSYDIDQQFRVYGGVGYLIRTEPHLNHWTYQVGGEFTGEHAYLGYFRPVAAADLQFREYTGNNPDFSLRTGIQIDSPFDIGRKLQLLLEYYNGHSQNGQFYTEKIEFLGIGAHFHF